MIACMACSEFAMAIPLLLYPIWICIRPFYHKYFKRHGVHGDEHCACWCHHPEDKDKPHPLMKDINGQPLNDTSKPCDIHGPDGTE